jgi:cytochrome c553
MRVADPMNDMAKGLSDDDLRKFAEIIAKLPAPHPADGPVDAARIERARSLVAQNHCNFCHTATFAGQDNVPNMFKALRGYKDNSRHGYDATMAEVMQPVSDDQILDLAYYIARVGAQ